MCAHFVAGASDEEIPQIVPQFFKVGFVCLNRFFDECEILRQPDLSFAAPVCVKEITGFRFAADIFNDVLAGKDFKLREHLVDGQIAVGQKHVAANNRFGV